MCEVRGARDEKGLLASDALVKFGSSVAKKVTAEPVAPEAATPPYRTKDLWVYRAYGSGSVSRRVNGTSVSLGL